MRIFFNQKKSFKLNNYKKTLLILSLFLFIYSCINECDENEFQSTNIDFVEIGIGSLSGSGLEDINQSNLVITNQTDWQELIIVIDAVVNVSGNFSETDIDFDNFILIAVFLELKDNGYDVEITNVIENENNITITTQETESLTLVMTQPYHIVKIPVSDKTVIFE